MPASRTLRFLSPAKLNLHLEVFGKRDDGFHELETLMTTVSIFDTIRFSLHSDVRESSDEDAVTSTSQQTQSISLNCRRAFGLDRYGEQLLGDLPKPTNNLVYKTALLMREEVANDRRVADSSRKLAATPLQIDLVKRIPSAAGLGGASSNSATTILALNQLWELNWNRERMASFAGKLGSDIPFFIYGKQAICRGRGELVTPVRCQTPMHAVVARPPASLSTKDVFGCLTTSGNQNETISNRDNNSDSELIEAVRHGRLFNRLQKPAEELCDEIASLKEEFESIGVRQHQLTGSGSCYFGIVANRRSAIAVANRLRHRNVGAVFVCQSI